jgi:CRISPR-associated endonuclease/helicase Cas3
LHDIGKATRSFLEYIKGKTKISYPHSLASFPIVSIVEHKLFGMPYLASLAVLSHHSPLTVNSFEKFSGISASQIGYYVDEIYGFLKSLKDYIPSQKIIPILKESQHIWTVQSPYSFLKTLQQTKNILSDASYISEFSTIKTILNVSDWTASGNKASNFVLNRQSYEYIKEIFKNREYEFREFQRACLKENSDIFLKAPTGTGKTEALLLWSKNKKIVYLLPTQTTTNSMWRRVIQIYGENNVGLAHGSSQLILRKNMEFYDEADDLEIYGEILLDSTFVKPVTVATLDQYLLAGLHGRHWENKMFMVRNASLIIDEIHTYDAYTLGLTIGTLKVYPPSSVAFASATFPKPLNDLLRKHLGNKVDILAETSLWMRKRHKLNLIDGSITYARDEIIDAAISGKNVLVVLNTVSDAQDFYKSLDYGRKMLLHSRFIRRDRDEKERYLENFKNGKMMNEEGFILVATQVVEVSLDISFDCLYTEISPIDALVQRMGRVNRNGEKGIAPVYIFTGYNEKSELVYGKDILEKSIDILRKIPETPDENDLIDAGDRLYDFVFNTEDFQVNFRDGLRKVDEFKRILGLRTISLHDEEMRKRFFTRLSNVVREEVIPWTYREEAKRLLESKKKWKIKELMVPVPINWLRGLQIEYITSRIFAAEIPYSKELGALSYEDVI